MTPLVSIVIPCHNAEPWLAASLESALGQSWPAKEVILVDDGSTDGSLSVARRYETRGLRVASQPNRGASAARNQGLRLAGGDLIQFLDADDLLSTDKVAAQVGVLGQSPPGTVASCRWGRFESDPGLTRFVDDAVFHDFAPARDFLIQAAATGDMIQPAAWLIPRPIVDKAGPWDETLSLNDDGEYFCRMLASAASIRFSPAGLVHYRSGVPGSLSRRRSKTALESFHRSHALFQQHLLGAEDSPRVRSALANYWERCRFELYPEAPDLSDDAARRARVLGIPTAKPPIGPRLRVIASLAGWKTARRIQARLRR